MKKKERKPPQIGLIFRKKFKGQEYSMKVVGEPDYPKYKVGDKIFKTPTAAAKHITNNEINGWIFWKMDY